MGCTPLSRDNGDSNFPGPGIGMKDGLTTANLPTGEWRL